MKTKIIILVITVIAIVVDIILVVTDHTTISRQMLEWSGKYPVVPFGVGFLMGHLFWSQDKGVKDGK